MPYHQTEKLDSLPDCGCSGLTLVFRRCCLIDFDENLSLLFEKCTVKIRLILQWGPFIVFFSPI